MTRSDPLTDQQAAQAVVRHHSALAATMDDHVTRLFDAADVGIMRQVWVHHGELVAWLHDELLPQADAEETSLYAAAGDLPAGKLLIEGMLGEHRAIVALVTELEASTSPVSAAAAARALQAVVSGHLAKENDLVVPLLIAAGDQSSAGLHATASAAAGSAGDGRRRDAAATVTPVHPEDGRIDVRDVPDSEQHAQVMATLDTLPDGAGLVLITPHAPLPLLAEIDSRYAGQVAGEWLHSGPDVWQIRLHRKPLPAIV